MLAQLTQDHDRLRELADRLDHYLQGSAAPVDIEFARLRWSLIRHLTMHLARKRAAFGSAALEADGCLDSSLDAQFEQHMTTWDARAIQRGWAPYCRASRSLLHRLRARMRREETLLFPRLAQSQPSLVMH